MQVNFDWCCNHKNFIDIYIRHQNESSTTENEMYFGQKVNFTKKNIKRTLN